MGKEDFQALIAEQQIEAVKAAYVGSIDQRSMASKFPALSHQKKHIFAVAGGLPAGLEDKALHRQVCKVLKQPVPDRCYTDIELRLAVVAYHFRAQDNVTIPSITNKYGPSKVTLWRQAKRLDAAVQLAGWRVPLKATPSRADVTAVAAAIDFPVGGRATLFLPDEEKLLLEMAAKHAEHGSGKGKRLQINYAKRALAHMAEQETDSVVKQRLGNAKLSRKWLGDARERVDKAAAAAGVKDPYKVVKTTLLSQTRAAAKKIGQNAAMFAQLQVHTRPPALRLLPSVFCPLPSALTTCPHRAGEVRPAWGAGQAAWLPARRRPLRAAAASDLLRRRDGHRAERQALGQGAGAARRGAGSPDRHWRA